MKRLLGSRRAWAAGIGCAIAQFTGGCELLVGADFDVQSGLSSGSGGAGGSGGAASSDGGGGAPSQTTGPGHGGSCAEPCYSGPAATKGVGSCKAGTLSCEGTCEGEVLPTAESCAAAADDNCDGKPGCSGEPVWARAIAGDGKLPDSLSEVGTFPNGDVFLLGTVHGSADLGTGQTTGGETPDAYAIRVRPDGTVVWAARYGGAGTQALVAGEIDAADGNIIVGGHFSGDINLGNGVSAQGANGVSVFVAKIDASSGAGIWVTSLGGGGQQLGDLAVSASGIAIVGGGFRGTIVLGDVKLENPSQAANDAFVIALDVKTGAAIWGHAFGDGVEPTGQVVEGLSVNKTGSVLVGGRYVGNLKGAGVDLPSVPQGEQHGFYVRFDKTGKVTDAAGLPGANVDVTTAAFVGEEPVVAGHFTGKLTLPDGSQLSATNRDAFAFRLGPGKLVKWKLGIGGSGSDHINDSAVDAAGNVVLGGAFTESLKLGGDELTSAGVEDGLLVKLDALGSPIWARRFGGVGVSDIATVAVDALGFVAIGGMTADSFDLGGGVALPPNLSNDAWAARLAP